MRAQGKTDDLRKRLEEYLDDPEGTRQRIAAAKEEEAAKKAKERKEKTKGWIDWRNHAAREILIEDLEQGGWLHAEDDVDARDVFEVYQSWHEEIFQEVPFSQFEVRYNEAIKKAEKRRARSAQELEWLKRDRLLHPRQTHNHRGEPVFDMDEKAKKQLRKDVKNKLNEVMSPSELWEMRKLYGKYKLRIFRQRIYQEVRRQKYVNYLNKKRNEKRRQFEAERRGEDVKIKRRKKRK